MTAVDAKEDQTEREFLAAGEPVTAKDTQPPEVLTFEAIERDPWNAVKLQIPDGNDPALWAVIETTANRLADKCHAEMSALDAAPGGHTSEAYARAEAAGFEADQRAATARDVLDEIGTAPERETARNGLMADFVTSGTADLREVSTSQSPTHQRARNGRDL